MDSIWNVLVVAVTTVALVFMVLMFVIGNPWLLVGIPGVLWAVAAVVRAITAPATRKADRDADVPGEEP